MINAIICKICNYTDNNKLYTAKEMMFGYRDTFDYIECGACGCVQIVEVPKDLGKYYPSNYYSFSPVRYRYNPIKILLKKKLIEYSVYNRNTIIGKLLARIYKSPEEFYPWFKKLQLPFSASILDVGCGSGQLLLKLRKSGFTNLAGADPFIKKDLYYSGGVTIYKKTLDQMVGSYDLIIFNHSFEHMENPHEIMTQTYSLLKPGGCALIRIPVAGTYAWRTYGVNWVQLDAPRHLFLHTVTSMDMLAAKAGFSKLDVEFDSFDFQFWGSEQYVKDIPLRDKRSYAENYDESLFSKQQMQEFREKAARLNSQNDGDAASFFYVKK